MQNPAWGLVVAGVVLVLMGLMWVLFPWAGKLPGDIVIEREHFRFYFPLTTCILLSVLLSGIFWLVRYFSSR